MLKAQQRKVCAGRNAATIVAFAFLVVLASCDSPMPTDVAPATVKRAIGVKTAVRSEFEGDPEPSERDKASKDDRCIIINGQRYCF